MTYEYDAAGRVLSILHETGTTDLLKIEYEWTRNNWVASRTETDYTVSPSTVAVVSFDYDNRGRLVGETRVVDATTTTYDLEYTYDQLGNRLSKSDSVAELETVYTYDVQLDPEVDSQWPGYPGGVYKTHNNRLLYYEVYDPNDSTAPNDWVLLRTVSYTYWDTGEAAHITVKDEYISGVTPGSATDYDWYNNLAMFYEGGRQTLRVALWDRWELNQYGNVDTATYERVHAREFRYEWATGGPRERYLVVDYDPSASNDPNEWTLYETEPNEPLPLLLTDYYGPAPYSDADAEADEGNWSATETVQHMFGSAQQSVSTGDLQYYHGDLIDSTMLTTDGTGDADLALTYSAFGEILGSSGEPGGDAPADFPRYQYAGGWGYESGMLSLAGANSDLPLITLQHLGHRWYQPDIGRFVQRDPIGLDGGMNVYAYCQADPLAMIDPNGTMALDPGFIAKLLKAGGAKLGGRAGAIVAGGGTVIGVAGELVGAAGTGYTIGTGVKWVGRRISPSGNDGWDTIFYYCAYGWYYPKSQAKKNVMDWLKKHAPSGGPDRIGGWICFVEGTMVSTGEGLAKIETLDVGSTVRILDRESGSALAEVIATHRARARELVHITLNNRSRARGAH